MSLATTNLESEGEVCMRMYMQLRLIRRSKHVDQNTTTRKTKTMTRTTHPERAGQEVRSEGRRRRQRRGR